MKLAVLGATGRTGRLLVEQALARGHEIKVLARAPNKLAELRTRVEVVEGSKSEAAAVERLVSGSDAVDSASACWLFPRKRGAEPSRGRICEVSRTPNPSR